MDAARRTHRDLAFSVRIVKELFLAVDPDQAPFQQIMDQFRGLIERGDLRAGDRLPTVRQLAGDLSVAPNTVARAYAELEAEGWITCDGRRGTHVSSRAAASDRRDAMDTLQSEVEAFVASLQRRGYSPEQIAKALAQGLKRASLSS